MAATWADPAATWADIDATWTGGGAGLVRNWCWRFGRAVWSWRFGRSEMC